MPRRPSLSRLAAVAATSICLLGAGWARAMPAVGREQPVNLRVTVALMPESGATLHYRGTFSGLPFGRGKAELRSTITGAGNAQLTFALTTARGRVRGSGNVTLTYRGDTVICRGTATISRGTGAYTRVRARRLRISGANRISSANSTMSLTGQITS